MSSFLGNLSGDFRAGWFSVLTFLAISMAVEREAASVFLLDLSFFSISATDLCVGWTSVLALSHLCALVSKVGLTLVFMAPKNILAMKRLRNFFNK